MKVKQAMSLFPAHSKLNNALQKNSIYCSVSQKEATVAEAKEAMTDKELII